MTSLSKITSYLGLADIDYLSSRLLLLSGIPTAGLSKAAEAFEKAFKLFFLLYEKIQNNKELDVIELKKYGHDLIGLYNSYNKVVPKEHSLGEDWQDLLQLLKDSYSRRYPEHWGVFKIEIDLNKIDTGYVYMRNNVKNNFPIELRERAEEFGTFLTDIYHEEYDNYIKQNGMMLPKELLKHKNLSYDILEINK